MATPAPAVAAAPTPPTTPPSPPAESRTITLNVTDQALIAEIDSWVDGNAYSFDVNQTAANTFDVTDAYTTEVEEEVTEEESAPATGGNPAIKNLLAKAA